MNQPSINAIIPLGGIGGRFSSDGYLLPKPLVRIMGKEMILWVLDYMNLIPGDKCYIVYNPQLIDKHVFEDLVVSKSEISEFITFAYLNGPTVGAAETVLKGLLAIPEAERDRPTMCFDGDGFYTINAVERYRSVCTTSGAVFSYVDKQPKPIFSYVKVEGHEFGNNRILEIREKMKISDYANTGTYCFRSGRQLERACRLAIERYDTSSQEDQSVPHSPPLSPNTKGGGISVAIPAQQRGNKNELFTSSVIQALIEEGEPFTMLLLNPGNFHSLGTPSLIQTFVSNWPKAPALRRFCFDLEGTLLTLPSSRGATTGDYAAAVPVPQNVAMVRRLHSQGHTIMLHTTAEGTAATTQAASSSVSIMQVLKEHGIPFHEIYFGKPVGDFYIDDKAVFSGSDLAKELGYYDLSDQTGAGSTPSSLVRKVSAAGKEDETPKEAEIKERPISLMQVAKEGGDMFLNVSTGLPVMQLRQLRTFFLFDIDGTLVGTDPLYMKVFTDLLRPFGYKVDYEFYKSNIHGRVDKDIFKSLWPSSYTDEQLAEAAKHKDELFCKEVLSQGVTPMPGLHQVLDFARRNGIQCGAISNAPRGACEALLEALEVWPYMSHLIIGAECKRAKPFPDPYLLSMHKFQANPEECIIFEDSRSGIQAGVASNARLIIGIQSSLSDHILRRHGAHATIRDFTQFTPDFLLQVHSSALDEGLNARCLEKLTRAGLPVESIPTALEVPGGYIARTLRLQLMYSKGVQNVEQLPVNAVLKIESPTLQDSVVETLQLYKREWAFYQHVRRMVPLRIPRLYCTVEQQGGPSGTRVEGLILEDLHLIQDSTQLELRPPMEHASLVVDKLTQMHAHFWGEPDVPQVNLISEFSMEEELRSRWPRFKRMWAHRLDPDALAAGEFIVRKWSWLQKQLSHPPYTLLHGNLRTGNVFLLKGPGGVPLPAFLDWQCVCMGKGVVDLAYFIIDAFDVENQQQAEAQLVQEYYDTLQLHGVFGYSLEQCWEDYKLATMFWPVFVSVWFGSQSVEEIVDNTFPSRIVPATFSSILRLKAVAQLPDFAVMDISHRCHKALECAGLPVAQVHLDAHKLKGGYICETLRLEIEYTSQDAKDPQGNPWPQSMVLKMEMPNSNDHQVAMDLHLYEREWHFYENVASLVPVRVPRYFGTLLSEDGTRKEGVLMEDLCVPGAVLNPKLDDKGVLLTVYHAAKMHAKFWNSPDLQGKMGVSPHNGPWFNPSWRNKVADHWPKFKAKWAGVLTPEAVAAGEMIINNFQFVQDKVSSAPFTFLHGDIKPPNMFMLQEGGEDVPAFIDWQYIAVGKSCCDILFMLVEGYDIPTVQELEPKVREAYYSYLVEFGVEGYSYDQLLEDWKVASMYFPIYVAMWFGTVEDEDLVDPMFPRRFVPRCFDCILRNNSIDILPK